MTFEPRSDAFTAAVETFADFTKPAAPASTFPEHAEVADPEAGWAARNPDRAMVFFFVSPRDCAALDELMAA